MLHTLEMVCAFSQAEMALASSKAMVPTCAHVLAGYGSSHVLRSGNNPRELVSSLAAAVPLRILVVGVGEEVPHGSSSKHGMRAIVYAASKVLRHGRSWTSMAGDAP